MPSNLNNNTAQTASVISIVGSSPTLVSGSLSAATGGDLIDYYRFTTAAVSNLNLTLGGLTGNARLKVFQVGANGARGSEIASSISNSTDATNNSGKLAESFIFNGLAAGSYLIQVDLGDSPVSTATADYTLAGLASVDGVSTSTYWRSPGNTPLAFWKANGFAYEQRGEFVPGFEIVGSGDFDGDKTTDLIWRQSGVPDSAMVIWLMNPDNTIKGQGQINLPGQNNTLLPAEIRLESVQDLNGDGKADLVWRNTDPNKAFAYFWIMDGTTVVGTSSYTETFLRGYDIVGYGDFNGDNRTDLLWQNKAAGVTVVWLMNGGQVIDGQVVTTPQAMTSRYTLLGVGNLNVTVGGSATAPTADRRSDALWYDTVTGEVLLWTMNGTQIGRQTKSSPVLPSSGWIFAATDDVSGDGNIDVVWRNVNSGAVGLWLLEGNGIKDAEFATNPIPAGFYIEGLADFNSDGAKDILWRSRSTNPDLENAVAIWLMGGGARGVQTRGEAFLLNVGAPAYTVENFRRMPQDFKGKFLTSQFTRVDQATAGTAAATGFSIGVLEGEGNYQDAVLLGGTDFFKFNLARSTKVNIDLLTGFNGPANSNAIFRLSRAVTGTNGVVTFEPVSFTAGQILAGGEYLVEVRTAPAVTNPATRVNYNLKLKGEPIEVNLFGEGITVGTDATPFQEATAIRLVDITIPVPNLPEDQRTDRTPTKLQYTLKNSEISNSGPVRVRFYISRNQQILEPGGNDRLIGEKVYSGTNSNGVPANTQITDVADVILPPGDSTFWTTDGDYYIGMVIDPVSQALPTGDITETNETDNFNQGLGKDIDVIRIDNTQIPDLLMTAIAPTNTAAVSRGAEIAVNYTVRNAGKRSTGSINRDVPLKFYLYARNTGLPAEQQDLLDTASPLSKELASSEGNFLITSNVGAESNVSESQTITLPAANDPYWSQFGAGTVFFIGTVLDEGNTFTESDEGNNLNRGAGFDRFQVAVAGF